MLNDRLQKHIKEKISQDPNWDKEALWNEIELNLDGDKKSRGFFLWLILGLLLASIISFGLFMYMKKQSSQLATDTKIEQQSNSELVNEELYTGEEVNTPSIETKSEAITKEIVSTEIELNIEASPERVSSVSTKPKAIVSNVSNESNESSGFELTDEAASEPYLNHEFVLKKEKAPYALRDLNMISPLETRFFKNELAKLEIDFPIASTRMQLKSEQNIKNTSIGLFSAAGGSVRHFDGFGESTNADAEARKNNDTPLEYLEFGLSLRQEIGYNLFLQSGLQYHHQTEKLEANFTEISSTKRNKADAYVFTNTSGAQEFIAATVEQEVNNDRNILNYNSLSWLSVPLQLGYVGTYGKFRYLISAGPAIRFKTAFKGKVLQQDNRVLSQSQSEDLYSNEAAVDVQVFTGLTYRIANQFSLDLGLQYNRQLQSVMAQDLNYGLNYSSFSGRLGLNYFINWN